MSKCRTFEIQLDNESDEIFHMGQEVRGRCVVEFSKGIRIKRFRVTFQGQVETRWTETSIRSVGGKSKTKTKRICCKDLEEYFKFSQDMTTHDYGRFRKAIPPGRFEFPFVFHLPDSGISNSFEGLHGTIRYFLKAELYRPSFASYYRASSRTINVMVPINRSYRELMTPVAATKLKTIVFRGKSGPVSIVVQTDQAGYFPGGIILLTGNIDNYSAGRVVPRVALRNTVHYVADGHQRVNASILCVYEDDVMEAGVSRSWNPIRIVAPTTWSSVLDSRLIRSEYHVEVTLDIFDGTDLFVELPICLGLMPVPPNPQPCEFIDNAELRVSNHSSAPAYSAVEADDAPPTYYDAIASVRTGIY